jgi:hypothetical protein
LQFSGTMMVQGNIVIGSRPTYNTSTASSETNLRRL